MQLEVSSGKVEHRRVVQDGKFALAGSAEGDLRSRAVSSRLAKRTRSIPLQALGSEPGSG